VGVIRGVDESFSENAECWLLVSILLLLLADTNTGLKKIKIGDDTTIDVIIKVKQSLDPDPGLNDDPGEYPTLMYQRFC
jgi:hypothetical protein